MYKLLINRKQWRDMVFLSDRGHSDIKRGDQYDYFDMPIKSLQ